MRSATACPARVAVQLVAVTGHQSGSCRLPIEPDGRARARRPDADRGADRAAIVVSGLTPLTKEPHAVHARARSAARGTTVLGRSIVRTERSCILAPTSEWSRCPTMEPALYALANLPQLQSGDLVPLSDFGSQGAAIHYKAWVCTNPTCGFNIKIRNGDVYMNEPIGMHRAGRAGRTPPCLSRCRAVERPGSGLRSRSRPPVKSIRMMSDSIAGIRTSPSGPTTM